MAKEKTGILETVFHPDKLRNDELAEEIAVLSAQMQNADYRLLVLIREFDEKGGWCQARRQDMRALAFVAHRPQRGSGA